MRTRAARRRQLAATPRSLEALPLPAREDVVRFLLRAEALHVLPLVSEGTLAALKELRLPLGFMLTSTVAGAVRTAASKSRFSFFGRSRLRGLSTSQPRWRRDPPPRTIHVPAAVAPRPAAADYPRRYGRLARAAAPSTSANSASRAVTRHICRRWRAARRCKRSSSADVEN